jgi:hypothetical protein
MDYNDIKVTDRQSFVQFLELFKDDLMRNKNHWENKTLEEFLEAMTRYSEDIQGYYDNREKENGEHINADNPSWRVFADILRGSKVYE